jgi:hypothetical protein
MAPLAKIVFDELRDRASEMVLADRNQSIETLLVDGSHEAFGVRVGIRRLPLRQCADSRVRRSGAKSAAPMRQGISTTAISARATAHAL